MNPIIKQWDTAKSLKRANQYKEALAIYETLCPKVETELSDNFDKAMFFGDYFGLLADVAQYDKAEAMAAIAQMLFLFPLSLVIALVMFPVV